MSDATKALILDQRTLEAMGTRDMAYWHGLTVIELREVYGRLDSWGQYVTPQPDSTHRRFVSKWETIDRKPADGANTSSDVVPTPPEGQADPISSTGGDGLPVDSREFMSASMAEIVELIDATQSTIPDIFPQPVDVSPPVASSPPSEVAYPSDGRAAEHPEYTTVACRWCGGRGFVDTYVGVLNRVIRDAECEICQGSGHQSIQIEATT